MLVISEFTQRQSYLFYKTLLLSCWFCQLSIIFIFILISISLRNLIIFSTLQSFPRIVFTSPWILYFFLLFHHWGHSLRQCLIVSKCFPHVAFMHFACWWFLDIKCQWTSLVCPIWTSYYLQLLWALSHSLMHGLM